MLTGTCFWQVQHITFRYTEFNGSLKVSENVQSEIWDKRGELQPGLSYAHLLLYIFGSKCMPRSNSQTFSVPEQILLNPDLEHSQNTDATHYCTCLLSQKHGRQQVLNQGWRAKTYAVLKHPVSRTARLHLIDDVSWDIHKGFL